MSLSGHQSARMQNDEWLTPPEIVRACGQFDLDPCAPIVRPWDTAARHFTVEDDGLAQSWDGRVICANCRRPLKHPAAEVGHEAARLNAVLQAQISEVRREVARMGLRAEDE